MENVKARREALAEEIRLGERRLPALGVLAVRDAQAHILAAAEEVRLRIGEFGQEALGRRVAAAEADRTRRLVFDLDHHDHAIGGRPWPVRDMNLLEVA